MTDKAKPRRYRFGSTLAGGRAHVIAVGGDNENRHGHGGQDQLNTSLCFADAFAHLDVRFSSHWSVTVNAYRKADARRELTMAGWQEVCP